jgi:hypothetical protein
MKSGLAVMNLAEASSMWSMAFSAIAAGGSCTISRSSASQRISRIR